MFKARLDNALSNLIYVLMKDQSHLRDDLLCPNFTPLTEAGLGSQISKA